MTPAGFEQLILDSGKLAHYEAAPIPDDPNGKPDLPPEEVLKKYRMRAFPPGSK